MHRIDFSGIVVTTEIYFFEWGRCGFMNLKVYHGEWGEYRHTGEAICYSRNIRWKYPDDKDLKFM